MPTIGEMLAGAAKPAQPRPSPLAGVLPAVFSAGDRLKRMARDFAADPMGNIQQRLGFMNDQAGQFNQLHNQATQESVNAIKNGGNAMGPASVALSNKLADAYNPVGMFVGVGAKTADKAALSKAQQMLDAGADNRDVWSQTGWFRGPDGKMRFEIDDSRAGIRLDGPKFGTSDMDKLSETLDHREIFKAYPSTKNINTTWSDAPGGGSYSEQRSWAEYIDLPKGANPADKRSIALHELQHAIQQREGFARGGNPEMMRGYANQYRSAKGMFDDAVQTLGDANADEIAKQNALQIMGNIGPKLKNLKELSDPVEAYRRIAGEAEARAVQQRMNLTAEQRRALFPLDSYDVPIDSLIFK